MIVPHKHNRFSEWSSTPARGSASLMWQNNGGVSLFFTSASCCFWTRSVCFTQNKWYVPRAHTHISMEMLATSAHTHQHVTLRHLRKSLEIQWLNASAGQVDLHVVGFFCNLFGKIRLQGGFHEIIDRRPRHWRPCELFKANRWIDKYAEIYIYIYKLISFRALLTSAAASASINSGMSCTHKLLFDSREPQRQGNGAQQPLYGGNQSGNKWKCHHANPRCLYQ